MISFWKRIAGQIKQKDMSPAISSLHASIISGGGWQMSGQWAYGPAEGLILTSDHSGMTLGFLHNTETGEWDCTAEWMTQPEKRMIGQAAKRHMISQAAGLAKDVQHNIQQQRTEFLSQIASYNH